MSTLFEQSFSLVHGLRVIGDGNIGNINRLLCFARYPVVGGLANGNHVVACYLQFPRGKRRETWVYSFQRMGMCVSEHVAYVYLPPSLCPSSIYSKTLPERNQSACILLQPGWATTTFTSLSRSFNPSPGSPGRATCYPDKSNFTPFSWTTTAATPHWGSMPEPGAAAAAAVTAACSSTTDTEISRHRHRSQGEGEKTDQSAASHPTSSSGVLGESVFWASASCNRKIDYKREWPEQVDVTEEHNEHRAVFCLFRVFGDGNAT